MYVGMILKKTLERAPNSLDKTREFRVYTTTNATQCKAAKTKNPKALLF